MHTALTLVVGIGILAGGCFIVGLRDLGRRLMSIAVVVLAIAAIARSTPFLHLPSGIGTLGAVVGAIAIVVAYLRFRERRKRFAKLRGEDNLSLKRRVNRI
jgi:hypothetical protein